MDGLSNGRKSTYSGNAGAANCVEAGHEPGTILIGDTADRGGPVLRVSPGAWKRFTATIQHP